MNDSSRARPGLAPRAGTAAAVALTLLLSLLMPASAAQATAARQQWSLS
ncbi:hypothetical protein [Micromonospora sp. NPDC093244]